MLKRPFTTIDNHLRAARRSFRASLRSLPSLGGVRTFTWVAVGLLLVTLVYLAQSSSAAMVARSLRVKEDRIAELQRQNSQLRFDIAAATAPGAIEKRAHKLGLAPAKTVVYASLPDLQPDRAQSVASLALPSAARPAPSVPSPVGQILAWFGFGNVSDRAQAQSQ